MRRVQPDHSMTCDDPQRNGFSCVGRRNYDRQARVVPRCHAHLTRALDKIIVYDNIVGRRKRLTPSLCIQSQQHYIVRGYHPAVRLPES